MNKVLFLSLLFTSLSEAAVFRVEASSSVDSGKYPAIAAFDNNPKTAWCSKESTPSFDIWLHESRSLNQLSMVNGYQKNSALFSANAKAASISVTYYDIFGEEIATASTVLKSTFGKVELLNLPKEQTRPIGRLHFKITNISPGKKYKDICISEIHVGSEPKPMPSAEAKDSVRLDVNKSIETLKSKSGFADFPKLIETLAAIAKAENSDGAKLFFEHIKKPSDGMETSITQLALLHFLAANPSFVLKSYQRQAGNETTLYALLFDEAGTVSKDSVILLLNKVAKTDESFDMAKALKTRLLNELTKE